VAWHHHLSERRRTTPRGTGGSPGVQSRSLGTVTLRAWRESDSVVLAWEHPDDDAGSDPSDIPDDATWALERSSAPYGPWAPLRSDLARATRQYRDDDAPLARTNSRFVYYRLKWSSAGDASSRIFGYSPDWELPADLDPELDMPGVTWGPKGTAAADAPAAVREIRRRLTSTLRSRGASPCLIYRPDWLSPMDPGAVNPLTGTHRGDYGGMVNLKTPRVNGYARPFETIMVTGKTVVGIMERSGSTVSDMIEDMAVELPHWPHVQVLDKIRIFDGTLFEVTGIEEKTLHDFSTGFFCNLVQLERTDPINKLPMPADFRQRALYPRRQGARSTTLEGYAKSLRQGSMKRASTLPPSTKPDSDS
jgi:hypothetical protein